jgi:hypothetical protein
MANSSDILLTAANDLAITATGDFSVGMSEQQESNLIINTFIGNWFQFPLVGIGLINYLAGSTPSLLIEQAIIKGLQNDGFIIENVLINNRTIGKVDLQITAHR